MIKNQLAGLMRQAQQVQNDIKQAKEDLSAIIVTGESGGGLVKIKISCNHDVRNVEIDPSLLADNEKEMLEDLIAAALNDALRKADRTSQEKMSSITSGISMPSGFQLPF